MNPFKRLSRLARFAHSSITSKGGSFDVLGESADCHQFNSTLYEMKDENWFYCEIAHSKL